MSTPSAAELLDAWDAGTVQRPPARSGPLLHLVAGVDPAAAARLGVGDRDRLLVETHAAIFGQTLRLVSECPSCGVVHELSIASADLLALGRAPEVLELDVDGHHVRCRVPTIADLTAAAEAATAQGARDVLVAAAVLAADRDGQPVAPSELPSHVVEQAAAALAGADPLADVQVPISCDACGERWTRVLDVDAYLWHELDSWAARLLQDVHVLARAYGWSEAQVLAVPPRRRRRYLELAGHG
jgi:hypothetical protein